MVSPKRRNEIVLVLGLLVVGIALLFLQPGARHEPVPTQTAVVRVAILTMGPFPLLDAILEETKATLERSANPRVEVRVFNPNFQQELLRKATREMANGDFAVLVSLSTPATQMLVAENHGRKPQVFAFVSTPAEIGITDGAPHPNLTGFIDTVPLDRNFDLVRRIVGDQARIGYLVNDGEAPARATFERAGPTVAGTKLKIRKIPVSAPSDIKSALTPVLRQVDTLFFGPDSVAASATDLIVSIGAERKVPVFCTDKISVGRGCLGSVAPDYTGLGRRTGEYVLKILQGEAVAVLPVVDFKDYVTYLNPAIAAKLGVSLPEDLRRTATLVGGASK